MVSRADGHAGGASKNRGGAVHHDALQGMPVVTQIYQHCGGAVSAQIGDLLAASKNEHLATRPAEGHGCQIDCICRPKGGNAATGFATQDGINVCLGEAQVLGNFGQAGVRVGLSGRLFCGGNQIR